MIHMVDFLTREASVSSVRVSTLRGKNLHSLLLYIKKMKKYNINFTSTTDKLKIYI